MRTFKGLSSNSLKLIAILAMTADHLAWVLFPGFSRVFLPAALHAAGRIAAPVMCFFIAEGYHHTRDIRRYTLRLFLFALLSHIPYLLAFREIGGWRSLLPFADGSFFEQTGVIWSLAWGLVLLRIVRSPEFSGSRKALYAVPVLFLSLFGDWNCIAPLLILAADSGRGESRRQLLRMGLCIAVYAAVFALTVDGFYGLLQFAALLSMPLLALYNGERGRGGRAAKWFFYCWYPLHLLVIGLFRLRN
jgi:hypothetical protein